MSVKAIPNPARRIGMTPIFLPEIMQLIGYHYSCFNFYIFNAISRVTS